MCCTGSFAQKCLTLRVLYRIINLLRKVQRHAMRRKTAAVCRATDEVLCVSNPENHSLLLVRRRADRRSDASDMEAGRNTARTTRSSSGTSRILRSAQTATHSRPTRQRNTPLYRTMRGWRWCTSTAASIWIQRGAGAPWMSCVELARFMGFQNNERSSHRAGVRGVQGQPGGAGVGCGITMHWIL